MTPISEFTNLQENNLIETKEILQNSNLVIHDAISQIAIMGTRGLQGAFRPDSDIDLGLILHHSCDPTEALCRETIDISLSNWNGDIELDIAIVFDKMNCDLLCYQQKNYKPNLCSYGKDCIGLYKLQKGFSGFVPEIGLEVKNIYPILIIWENENKSF